MHKGMFSNTRLITSSLLAGYTLVTGFENIKRKKNVFFLFCVIKCLVF
jgi:hypothetical protein